VGEGLRCGDVFVWKGGFAWGLNDEALRASRAGKVESMAYGAFKTGGFLLCLGSMGSRYHSTMLTDSLNRERAEKERRLLGPEDQHLSSTAFLLISMFTSNLFVLWCAIINCQRCLASVLGLMR
jgi:hypothetical protein